MKFIFSYLFVCIVLSGFYSQQTYSASSQSSYRYKTDLTDENWLTAKNGRTVYLFGTSNKEKIKKFIPTERAPEEQIIERWKIVLHPPVFFSNQENLDTSKDQVSSVLIYKLEGSKKEESQLVFVAKGYKFFVVKSSADKNSDFVLRYWSGVMGCSFVDMGFSWDVRFPSVKYRSTKDEKLCMPSKSIFDRLDRS